MGWSMIFELIETKFVIVVAVCWVFGFILKQTPKIASWSIVYIIIIVAILLAIWLEGFGPDSVIQGVLAGAFAVFGHQVVKQGKEAFKSKDDIR